MQDALAERETSQIEIWQDLLAVLLKYRRLIFAVFFATVLSAYAILQLMSQLYVAEARLQIKIGYEQLAPTATASKQNVQSTGVRKETLNSEIQLLTSRALIKDSVEKFDKSAFDFDMPKPETLLQAVRYIIKKSVRWVKARVKSTLIAMKLKDKLSNLEEVIVLVEKSLDAQPVKDSDVIKVSIRLPSALMCQSFLETHIKNYMDRRLKIRGENQVTAFFDSQLNDYQIELASLDTRIESLRKQYDLDSIADQRRLLLGRLDEILSSIDKNQNQLDILNENRTILEKRLKALPEAEQGKEFADGLISNPSASIITQQISERHLERARLSSVVGSNTKMIRKLDEEIARLEGLLRRSLEVSIHQLQNQAKDIRVELDRITLGERQLADLERKRGIAAAEYAVYHNRGAEAKIAEELDRRRLSNIQILSHPELPFSPYYPRKLLIMTISLPIGLLLGMGFALILEYFNDRVSTRRDLADVEGVLYLGTFRPMKT